jgi:hypothetical protein
MIRFLIFLAAAWSNCAAHERATLCSGCALLAASGRAGNQPAFDAPNQSGAKLAIPFRTGGRQRIAGETSRTGGFHSAGCLGMASVDVNPASCRGVGMGGRKLYRRAFAMQRGVRRS